MGFGKWTESANRALPVWNSVQGPPLPRSKSSWEKLTEGVSEEPEERSTFQNISTEIELVKKNRFVYDIVLYYTVGLMSGKRCLYRHNNNWGYNFFHFDFIKALSKVYPLIWTILYFLECWMATAICRILFLDWETEWSYFWLWIGKAVLADSNILFYTASIPMWPAED